VVAASIGGPSEVADGGPRRMRRAGLMSRFRPCRSSLRRPRCALHPFAGPLGALRSADGPPGHVCARRSPRDRRAQIELPVHRAGLSDERCHCSDTPGVARGRTSTKMIEPVQDQLDQQHVRTVIAETARWRRSIRWGSRLPTPLYVRRDHGFVRRHSGRAGTHDHRCGP
jgi:hypothetical protein